MDREVMMTEFDHLDYIVSKHMALEGTRLQSEGIELMEEGVPLEYLTILVWPDGIRRHVCPLRTDYVGMTWPADCNGVSTCEQKKRMEQKKEQFSSPASHPPFSLGEWLRDYHQNLFVQEKATPSGDGARISTSNSEKPQT